MYLAIRFNLSPFNQDYFEVLSALLDEAGFEGIYEEEEKITAYLPEQHYTEEGIHRIVEQLSELRCQVSFTKEQIPDQNWNALWESNFEPVVVGRQCAIRAPFHPQFPEVEHQITIEPKMSFGTGHHQTTRLMIEQMFNIDFTGKKVLDMGCGTGVLAILASLRNARQVTAIDIDSWAYENTLENIERNACHNIEARLGSVEAIPDLEYHCILANINRNILLEQIPYYAKHTLKNGMLLLSGILEEDFPVIEKACLEAGFTYKSHKVLKNWCMIVFERE